MKSHEDEAKEEKGEEEEVEVFARWPRPRGGEGGVGEKVVRRGGGLTTVFMHAKKDFPLFFLLCESEGCEKGGRKRACARISYATC